jgi:hypothetical protein
VTVNDCNGSFDGMLTESLFNIVVASSNMANGGKPNKVPVCKGKK